MNQFLKDMISLSLFPPIAEIQIKGKRGMNILNRGLLLALKSTIDRLDRDEKIKVVLLYSGHSHGFAAGADMHELKELNVSKAISFSKMRQDLFLAMENMAMFFIGVVNGYCIGGGFDLALACDIIVFSQKASFQHPGSSWGFITGFGGNSKLPELMGKQRSLQALMTAKKVLAREMTEALSSFLNYSENSIKKDNSRHAIDDHVLTYSRQIATKVAAWHPEQILLIKKILQLPRSVPLKNRARIESYLSLLYTLSASS